MTNEQVDSTFTYHAPSHDQARRYVYLRADAKKFAYAIQTHCPESREKSLALTNLQQAVMWANASIALEPPAPEVKSE